MRKLNFLFAVIFLTLAITLPSCGEDDSAVAGPVDSLVGTWGEDFNFDGEVISYITVYNANGTGENYTLFDGVENTEFPRDKFTWTATDTRLTETEDDPNDTGDTNTVDEFFYMISGNTLTLTYVEADASGNTETLTLTRR